MNGDRNLIQPHTNKFPLDTIYIRIIFSIAFHFLDPSIAKKVNIHDDKKFSFKTSVTPILQWTKYK